MSPRARLTITLGASMVAIVAITLVVLQATATTARLASAATVAAAGPTGTPTIPQPPTKPGPTHGPVPVLRGLRAGRVIHLPAGVSYGKLVVRFSAPTGVRLSSLLVTVTITRHGRPLQRISRHRVPRSLTVSHLPRGGFSLTVSVTANKTLRLTSSHRYRGR